MQLSVLWPLPFSVQENAEAAAHLIVSLMGKIVNTIKKPYRDPASDRRRFDMALNETIVPATEAL